MQNYREFTVAILLTFGLTPGLAQPTSASEITDGLKATINGVIEIVKDQSLKDDKKSRRAAMRKLIDPKFSYQQMSMRALAKNWRSISQDEQREFVGLFSRLLENSYASKLEAYSDEKIKYVGER